MARITLPVCPKVERQGGQIVGLWDCISILAEVDGLYIRFAGVASLDSNVGKFLVGKHRELIRVLFAAVRTEYTPKLPFRRAKRAEEEALGSVIQLSQYGEQRRTVAYGTA
jgi:hypothetical protein